ncbi:hypothetical protein OQX63_03700 [Pedobacter sp. PF22-3]|uniref:hypothetical protein n=1 Tax=Pedobacter sp. PF22-3 TaxID=2994467 RepID=UPI0022483304|nr:hypothetical protein [Pedobacter sp. PF22-3]MCX2492561.1 hypothetical protein [Pedobacter sp. PF22-3]
MKKVVFTLVFFSCSLNLFAGNPGPNYACWGYLNNKFYTHYLKDDTYLSWGWGLKFPYYDSASGVINVAYYKADCNEINPNNPFVWTPRGGTCFINMNGSIYQGNLGTINYGNFNPCNVSLDDSIWILYLASALLAFIVLTKQKKLAICN